MWKKIHVGHETYLISSEFVDGKWKMILTDLIELWTEVISREQVIDKCQKLNPLLIIEDIDVDVIINEILDNIAELALHATTKKIQLQTTVEGGIFRYDIDMIKSSPQQLWLEVTMPLCLCVDQFKRQKDILRAEIRRKDEEILEYKSNGGELIRKNIETKPFDDNIIEDHSPVYEIDSCMDIFQSAMNSSQTSKLIGKFRKHESILNYSETQAVTAAPVKEEQDVDLTHKRNFQESTPPIQPEAKVSKLVTSSQRIFKTEKS